MMSALFSTISLAACAQSVKVPEAVKTAFANKFPGATAEWGKENSKEYEAEFKLDGKSMSANFLTDGTWLETEAEISMTDVPSAVKTAVEKKYPGAVISKVYKIDNSKGELTYEAEIKTSGKKKELVLKADGTIIK